MLVEDARNYSVEHIAAPHNIATKNQDAEVVKKVAAEQGGKASQRKTLFHFEEEAVKKKKIGSILYRMDDKRFAGVQNRRFNPVPIIRARCTKPKKDKILTLHITRNGPSQNTLKMFFPASL